MEHGSIKRDKVLLQGRHYEGKEVKPDSYLICIHHITASNLAKGNLTKHSHLTTSHHEKNEKKNFLSLTLSSQ
jgi:hypothetical protein